MAIYPIVLSQSRFIEADKLTYPFEERGLQFGDGIYEVIRIYEGTYDLLSKHIDRLFRSADAIQLALPFSKQSLSHQLQELLEQNNMISDGIVYLQVTRGSAPRTHTFPSDTPVNFHAYIQDMPRKTESMLNGVSAITHPDTRWEYCYIKSLNLLPNVLAKQAAYQQNSYEAVLIRNGLITECSSSNMFLVKNGHIYTHPETEHILHGCVRSRVKRCAANADIPLIEEAFEKEALADADELFLTSTTSEIMPVITVDGKAIGNGEPGPVTRKLQRIYAEDAHIKSIID